MSESITGSQFTTGEWTVEPNLGRIHRNGESTILEPRVMALLVFLAERAGETVSTDELAEKVWSGRAITDQPVYQGIAQLRKALDDEARDPRYIVTISKKGYRLIAPVGMPQVETVPTPLQHRSKRQPRFLVPVLSLILAGSYLFVSSSDIAVSRVRAFPVAGEIGSIAVLPFVDMSEDHSQQYLGDGIAEELIHRIAAVPDLRVVARTSSFTFRDGTTDVQSIGELVGADAILEGSVRRSGDRLRITAQLVSAGDGYHIWSRSYESVFSDALAVQDEIARNVAQLLQTGGKDGKLPERSWTQNPDAAEAYYLGMFHLQKNYVDSFDPALAYFQEAITHDPQFALAYAGLANTWLRGSENHWGRFPHEEATQNSSAALRTAQLLDNRLPEVILLLASEAARNGDLAEAEILYLRAIDVNPNDADAYDKYGRLLRITERLRESLSANQKAVELDPLRPQFRMAVAERYMILNRSAEAEKELLTAIELDPDWHAPYAALGSHYFDIGQYARAIGMAKKAVEVEPQDANLVFSTAMGIGYTYAALQDFESAEKWFAKAIEIAGEQWFLTNPQLHMLLAQDRFDEVDSQLTYWTEKQPNEPNILSLGGLYRAVMAQDARAVVMLEAAQALPREGEYSNLFRRDFLSWGYLPAVHLARLYSLDGRTVESQRLLEQSEQFIVDGGPERAQSAGAKYVRASIQALRGDKVAAIESIRAAVDNGWFKPWFAERDPIFADYRGDPDFELQLERMRAHLATERQKLAL